MVTAGESTSSSNTRSGGLIGLCGVCSTVSPGSRGGGGGGEWRSDTPRCVCVCVCVYVLTIAWFDIALNGNLRRRCCNTCSDCEMRGKGGSHYRCT